MSIAAKHAYRFGYLKSEAWQTVRLEVLARDDARCFICDHRSLSNDAHHRAYPENIWNTTAEHCVILCRDCHDWVHRIGNRESPKFYESLRSHFNRVGKEAYKHLVSGKSMLDGVCNLCDQVMPTERRVIVAVAPPWPMCQDCWIAIDSLPPQRGWAMIRNFIKNYRLTILPVYGINPSSALSNPEPALSRGVTSRKLRSLN